MLYLLTFGPLALTLFRWIRFVAVRGQHRPTRGALLALAGATVNALVSSGIVVYYAIHPDPANVPPWEDGQILYLSLLLFSVPIAMLLGLVAGIRGAPKWLVAVVEVGSVPLLLIGFLAVCAV